MHILVLATVLVLLTFAFPNFLKALAWLFVFPLAVMSFGWFTCLSYYIISGNFSFQSWIWCCILTGIPFGLYIVKDMLT